LKMAMLRQYKFHMNYKLNQNLKKLSLHQKLLILLFFAMLLLFSGFIISTANLQMYFFSLMLFVIILTLFCYLIIGKRSFKPVIALWFLGTVIYLLIAVFRIYHGGTLSPYLHLQSISERWLYSLILPLITLGTFSIGLIFINIISPIEFLIWGKFGLKIVLLLRALQHSIQIFQETKKALMMQNKWSEESNKIVSIKGTFLAIKYSPLLIKTSFRNILLFWYPWGWLCFNVMHKNLSNKNNFIRGSR